jgi:hypothetical protein
MPKLRCHCGYVHDLSPIPDAGYVVVADRDYEALVEAERVQSATSDRGPSPFVSLTGRIYECPECGRIMWERPGDRAFRIYRPETDAFGES